MKLIPVFIFLMLFPSSLFAGDVKVDVSSRAGDIIEDIDNFLDEDDSKKEKIKTWFTVAKEKSEAFRTENLAKFLISKDKIATERENSAEFENATKVLLFLHFYILVLAIFIFSIVFIFYTVGFALLFCVLRVLWNFLRRIFRKKHEV